MTFCIAFISINRRSIVFFVYLLLVTDIEKVALMFITCGFDKLELRCHNSQLFHMVHTVGQYRILNRTKVKGKTILHLFSTRLLRSTSFFDFRYTIRANSNIKKLTQMRHMTIQMSRQEMQLTLGTECLMPLNIAVKVRMVVIARVTLPGMASGGMYRDRQPVIE